MTEKRLRRPRDPVQLGKMIGDILTGQTEEANPNRLDDSDKDPAAVALGRRGGKVGGPARAVSLTAEERKKIAKTAANKRWATSKPKI